MMKKYILWAFLLLTVVFSSHFSKSVFAAELLTNGGFESGNFSGWSTVNVTTNLWYNWTVSAPTGVYPGCGPCITEWVNGTSPHSGNFSAWNGWAAWTPVPDAYRLRQDVTIPNNPNELVRLVWWDRLQWDLQTYATAATSTLPQYRVVSVLNPATNAVIQEIDRTTAPAFSRGPMLLPPGQGWTQHIANLSAYKGQTIRLELMCTIAQSGIGPGFCEFDDVSLATLVPTAASVAVSGRVLTSTNQGVSKVTVTLTDVSGNVRQVLTNPLGYYKFGEVEAGQTYIVTLNHKQYQFASNPRVLNVGQEITDADFLAIP